MSRLDRHVAFVQNKQAVSRLIAGSNLISMNMHARDLIYMPTLAAHYNTEERIFLTLKQCEQVGVTNITSAGLPCRCAGMKGSAGTCTIMFPVLSSSGAVST